MSDEMKDCREHLIVLISFHLYYMAKKLYVGNVSWNATNESLMAHLSSTGIEIASVNIITDRHSGRSRGFAFVDIDNDEDMQKIIDEFNEKEFDGRPIFINEARPKEERPSRPSDKKRY